MAKDNIGEIVYPIWQAATLAEEMVDYRIKNKHKVTKSRLPNVDDFLNPFYPGTLACVLGRPQNAKTFIGMYMLQENMREMKRLGADKNEVCILITTEVFVEIAALQWMARISGLPISSIMEPDFAEKNIEKIQESSFQIMGLPLFIIGHSIQRDGGGRRNKPMLSPNKIDDALEFILNNYREKETDSHIEPKLIVTDYLQKLHKENQRQDTLDFFSGAVGWAKDVAFWCACTHVLNVQAGRQVDDRQIKIPQLRDGQWTSTIEQFGDVIFGVHMPKVYNIEVMPELTTWNIPELVVTDNLIYLALIKQKEGAANKGWAFYGDMGRLKLEPVPALRHS